MPVHGLGSSFTMLSKFDGIKGLIFWVFNRTGSYGHMSVKMG